jgi:hypothetical protein
MSPRRKNDLMAAQDARHGCARKLKIWYTMQTLRRVASRSGKDQRERIQYGDSREEEPASCIIRGWPTSPTPSSFFPEPAPGRWPRTMVTSKLVRSPRGLATFECLVGEGLGKPPWG